MTRLPVLARCSPTTRHWLLVGSLALLTLLLRLYRLDAQSLWLDEGSSWQIIQQGWGPLLLSLFDPNEAYPLYHVLLKAWIALVGDSAWALRFPSALAGAGAVAAIYWAGLELQRISPPASPLRAFPTMPTGAAVLLLISPFAIWYGQEAKVYSLLLLMSALLLWSLLRAMRQQTRRAWLLYGLIALAMLFVHRLAVLLLVASYGALLLSPSSFTRHTSRPVVVLRWLLFVALSGAVVWVMILGLGAETTATGGHMRPGPLRAVWLTFVRFCINRGPGEVPWWWLLPWLTLAGWGLVAAVRDIRKPAARVLLCFLLLPLMLFLAQLSVTRFYEARYLMLIYPAWLLLLAYPPGALNHSPNPEPRTPNPFSLRPLRFLWFNNWSGLSRGFLIGAVCAVSVAALFQPRVGLFSGDPVKEQFREAMEVLTQRIHPDDIVVLHPFYLRPLYTYYMHRLTPDPPPEPVVFDDFKQGQQHFTKREWQVARRKQFAGHLRSFLLIAPEHARTVDMPNPHYNDQYGVVGLYYEYSREEKKWPCGIWRYNGVHLLCQESPEAYVSGEVPQPATPVQATFGDTLHLLGYTLKPTTPQGVGIYRAGGVVPISLFWDVAHQPESDYHMFLHLCRDCDQPPAASHDGPPLEGYLPTGIWLPRKPARDDRAIPLPPTLSPGTYTLLMGVYRPDNPAPDARLPVSAPAMRVLSNNRLVLTTIQVVQP